MLGNAGTLSTRRSFVKTQSTQRPRTSDFLSWLAAAGRKAVGLALELRPRGGPGIGLVGPCNDTLCAKKCSPSGQFTIHNSQIQKSTTTLRMNTSPPSVPSFHNRNAFGATDATPSFPPFFCLVSWFCLFCFAHWIGVTQNVFGAWFMPWFVAMRREGATSSTNTEFPFVLRFPPHISNIE